jgi:hypothetical protein
MCAWCAGCYNHFIDNTVVDILTDHLLAGVRTHEKVLSGYNDVRQGLRMLADGFDIDDTADIGAAMTDIYSNFCHAYLR